VNIGREVGIPPTTATTTVAEKHKDATNLNTFLKFNSINICMYKICIYSINYY
jgi:hypothetical protein